MEHPDWLPYLMGVDLVDCLREKYAIVEEEDNFGFIEQNTVNIYKLLIQTMSKNELLDLISKYGRYIDKYNFTFSKRNIADSEAVKGELINYIYINLMKDRSVFIDELPMEFRKLYPRIFLSDEAPSELKKLFYHRELTPSHIIEHPEYRKFLIDLDMRFLFNEFIILEHRRDGHSRSVNLVSLLEERYGKERAFDILSVYDSYLSRLNTRTRSNIIIQDTDGINEILDKLDSNIFAMITTKHSLYDMNMSNHFKNNYPELFLPADAPNELQAKFYAQDLSVEDFLIHPEYINYFKNTNIEYGCRGFIWLNEFFKEDSIQESNSKKLKLLYEFAKVNDDVLEENLKEFILANKEHLDMSKVRYMADILCRLSLSNSSEIYNFRMEIAEQLLKTDNPIDNLNKIEDLFLKNNIPTIGKIYSVFNILHPQFKGFDFSDDSMISPVLKSKSNMAKSIIVFSDLIRTAFGSNNRSVRKYLEDLEKGNMVFEAIFKGEMTVDELDEKQRKHFEKFCKYLKTMYESAQLGKEGNAFSENDLKNVVLFKKFFSSDGTLDYNLADRVVSMFCHFAGIDTLAQAKAYLNIVVKEADARNRMRGEQKMELEEGDFVKGIGEIKFLGKILQNGSIAKEFLGASALSDATPLDTDLSRITTSDGSIAQKIALTEAGEYGPIWVVLKNSNRLKLTRDSEGNDYDTRHDSSKLEIFYTGAMGNSHYGIRTGFPSTAIDYIVTDEPYDERIGLEIAMNGFYIPVANKTGKIVFKPQDYDLIREKLRGLKPYSDEIYECSPNLVNDSTEIIVNQLRESREMIGKQRTIIYDALSKTLEELSGHYLFKNMPLCLQTSISDDLLPGKVEVIDIGSTSRDTNVIKNGDFDFIIRLDRSIITSPIKMKLFRSTLLKNLGKDDVEREEVTGLGDFRLKNVQLDDMMANIDVSFELKTDELSYSTDMALKDRLDSIKKQSPKQYDYVLANIILAKTVLKNAGIYKPKSSEEPQGGLGGVGIENWILNYGGSFEDAAKSFVRLAENKSFEEFKKCYPIYDFGENHFSIRDGEYPHSEFISTNMTNTGYERMVVTLKNYLQSELGQNQELDNVTHKRI